MDALPLLPMRPTRSGLLEMKLTKAIFSASQEIIFFLQRDACGSLARN